MPVQPNQLFLIGDSYYAVNPQTGQPEPVFQDLAQANPQATGGSDNAFNNQQFQPTYYFQSDLPAGAVPTAVRKDTPSNVALGLAPIFAGMGAGALFGEGLGAGLGGAELTAGLDEAVLLGGEGADVLGGVGGLNPAVTGSPGFTAGGFTPSALGVGGEVAAPGIAATTGGGSLAPGFFAGETLYPALGATAASTLIHGAPNPSGVPVGPGTIPGTLGTLGATALGVYGADQASDSYSGLSSEILAKYQPFLDQSLAWMKDPNAYFMGPGKSALDANLAALSVHGNPATSPWALGTANEAALKNWQQAVLGFGNVGLGGTGAQANLGSQAINADSGVYNALGSGIANLTNPQPTILDLIKAMGGNKSSTVSL